jgi:hypothetical protein
MISEELIQAYLTTTYRVDQLNVSIRIGQIDEGLEGILEKHGCDEWAFITAYNAFSVLLKEDVNAMRHLQLLRDVSSFTFFDGEGVGEDPAWKPEKSLLIIGIDRESAKELGLKYGQNAIVVGSKSQVAELLVLMTDL